MSRLLTPGQSEELHKSIIAYLVSHDFPQTALSLREELNIGDTVNQDTLKKYEGLLERKWTSVVRLQKKIMELERIISDLRADLDTALPISSRQDFDPTSWLPAPQARHTLQSHKLPITSLTFHPVFSILASGSEDSTIKIWDWETGDLEKTLKGHTRAVMDVDFGGPKGRIVLASCSTDLTIRLWDPSIEYANVRTLFGHDHSISAVRFLTAFGNLLASASRDGTVRIWDISSGYCVKVVRVHTDWVRTVASSFDGQWLLSGGNDRTATIWDAASGEIKATLIGHENFIECCAFAPPSSYSHLATLAGQSKPPPTSSSNEYVATGARDKSIKIWNAQGLLVKSLIGHDNWVRGLLFHPGGKHLLSVADDKTLRCWDLSQGGRLVKTLHGIHDRFITCIRWAPSLSQETEDLTQHSTIKHGVKIRCTLATGGVDSILQVFVP